ncbi:unnamed protein product [Heligmosomoides polygyrus]|uniref:G_PROTEIN_RECEP_F1_2 domain-containing protein n=1 Tax=Heligmosomoides polygyrus TaxID=6339 RepID=A0A183G2E5_HELPZ|nr:unnamed protein product [Heligmosomoides polygyrus]
MPAALVVVLLTVHALTATIAFLVNLILLVIIVLNTPKPIRTYSVLIVNYVLTDLFTSMAQAITVPRLITSNHSFVLIFYGACTKVGSSFCFSSFLVEIFGFSHGLNSVLLSIAYRYFSLRYGVPKRKPIIILCLLVCIPSLVPMAILWHKWSDGETIRHLLQVYRPDAYDDSVVVAGK